MLRKILITLLAFAILIGSWYISKMMAGSKKRPAFKPNGSITAVYVQSVNNGDVPVSITATGQVQAKEKAQIYSEVQGIMERGTRRFFEGTFFKKGDVMIRVNSEEFATNLKAQRANLFNQIVSIMPDLRLDYPGSTPEWESYIADYDENRTLKPLPDPKSEQEKYYIAGKQIYTSFYSIKNLEVKLAKYDIIAPFSGYLSEALVKEGTLIRPGQKLGEIVSSSIYELEVPINASYENLVKIGKKVITHDIERTRQWTGTITRINKKIDPATQSFTVYIELRGDGLSDGMFLEADLDAKSIENAFEIERKLLGSDNSVFMVSDSVLQKVFVEPVYFKHSTVIVKNLPDQAEILSNAVPSAYPGMKVEVLR
jgi:multidrug efflux pump subunit AcrA (membrane-fusion protein)